MRPVGAVECPTPASLNGLAELGRREPVVGSRPADNRDAGGRLLHSRGLIAVKPGPEWQTAPVRVLAGIRAGVRGDLGLQPRPVPKAEREELIGEVVVPMMEVSKSMLAAEVLKSREIAVPGVRAIGEKNASPRRDVPAAHRAVAHRAAAMDPLGPLLASADVVNPLLPRAMIITAKVRKKSRLMADRRRRARTSISAAAATAAALRTRLSILIGRSIGVLPSAIIGATGE